MERMSSKHSPRVDDQLGHEVESLMRGNAAEESHAREDRTQEGPAEDELRFEPADRTRPEERGIGISDSGPDTRSELARHLAAVRWPAGREDLVTTAQADRAPQEILDRLRHLSNEARLENVQEVWSALGGETEAHSRTEH